MSRSVLAVADKAEAPEAVLVAEQAVAEEELEAGLAGPEQAAAAVERAAQAEREAAAAPVRLAEQARGAGERLATAVVSPLTRSTIRIIR